MHTSFILDILIWIDQNLRRDIVVSDIVERSGYSNSQLHRIFKSKVGCSINEYIISKRLHKCAYALKYTKISLKELSRQYHYSNPQSFTRFFSSFFGMTPIDYRLHANLTFKQLYTWKHRKELETAGCRIEFIYLESLILKGVSGDYPFPPELASESHSLHRGPLENEFQELTKRPVDKVFTLCKPTNKSSTVVCFEYHVGVLADSNHADVGLRPLPAVRGDYLKFTFANDRLKPFEMCSIAYWSFISAFNIVRRDGYDIENFDFTTVVTHSSYAYILYIPVIFDNSLIDMLLSIR